MRNNYNKEEQDFLNLFSQDSAEANPIFKARLKAKMLNKLEPKFNPFGVFANSGLSFFAVIAFSFITVFSGFLILSELSKNQNKSVTVVSDQVKQQVIEKVAEKTSVTALNLLNVNEFLSKDSVVKPVKSVDDSYNLKKTEVTYIPTKEESAVCTNLNLPKELTVTQLYEYFGVDKTVSKIVKNNETLALTEFPNDNVQPVSFTVSYPVSFPTIQTNLLDFTSNLEVSENTDANKKSFTMSDYVVFDCGNKPVSFPASFPTSFAVTQDKIIREFILNPDYSINKVNLYLNSIERENLIAEITISSSTLNVAKEDASQIINENL